MSCELKSTLVLLTRRVPRTQLTPRGCLRHLFTGSLFRTGEACPAGKGVPGLLLPWTAAIHKPPWCPAMYLELSVHILFQWQMANPHHRDRLMMCSESVKNPSPAAQRALQSPQGRIDGQGFGSYCSKAGQPLPPDTALKKSESRKHTQESK